MGGPDMRKSEALEALAREIEENQDLPLFGSANIVFGEGNPDCDILFAGEAPGFHEDQLKRPFVGRAGQLLDKLNTEIGLRREDVYITNIVKRRPPENRDPLPEEIEAYKPYLARQLEIIQPKIVVLLGRFSMNCFLPDAKITRDQGKIFWCGDQLVMPVFHPAAALRSPSVLEETKKSFAKIRAVIKKYEDLRREHEAKKIARAPVPQAVQAQLF